MKKLVSLGILITLLSGCNLNISTTNKESSKTSSNAVISSSSNTTSSIATSSSTKDESSSTKEESSSKVNEEEWKDAIKLKNRDDIAIDVSFHFGKETENSTSNVYYYKMIIEKQDEYMYISL